MEAELRELITPENIEDTQQTISLRATLRQYVENYPTMNDTEKVQMLNDIRSAKYQEQDYTLLRSELECLFAEDVSMFNSEPYTYDPAINNLVEELQKYINTFSDMSDEEKTAKYTRALEIVQPYNSYMPIVHEFSKLTALYRRHNQLKMILENIESCNNAFDSGNTMTKLGVMCYMKQLVQDVFIQDEQYIKAVNDLQEKVVNSDFMRQLSQYAE